MDTRSDHLSVIRASGADAVTFLQGQLSNDFALLPTHQWQLAAYCSPQGRMLASFWGLKLTGEDVVLVVSKDIAAQTLKRLSMFVLRAKVTLVDASEMLPELFSQHGLAAWSTHEVERGIARITAPTVDLFVPQMLNYESVGGVSFKKGCYPGQEVVARSQFRGAIKRRTYLVQVSHTTLEAELPMAGQEVFAVGEEPSIGVVVLSTRVSNGEIQALVCLQTRWADADLRLGSALGKPLQIRDLPYKLLDDI